MTDPLTKIEPGPPCPSCGCRVSLQALKDVRDELRRRKNAGHTVWGSRSIQVGGGAGGGGAGGAGGGSIILDIKGDLNMAPGAKISAGSPGPIQPGGGLKCGSSQNVVATGGDGGQALGVSGNHLVHGIDDALGAVSIDGLICADCGTFFKPDTRPTADELRQEIKELRLELDSAVDLLGRVSDE